MASSPVSRNGNAPSHSTPTHPATQKIVVVKRLSPEVKDEVKRVLLLPKQLMRLEPTEPETFINKDPLFKTRAAATDSWRQL